MAIAPLPQGRQVFVGLTGEPLSGGKVFTYAAGTTTPMPTWQDPQQVSLNTNPVLLDANGSAVIYGWGAYTLLVEDSLGNVISSSLTFGGPLTQTFVIFNTVGTGNFTIPAGVYSLYIECVAGGGGGSNCSAGTATQNVSGGGGGAGGFANGIYSVTPGQVLAYEVGRGGPAQTPGATTAIGAITCLGGRGSSFSPAGTCVGGIGGVAAGGNILNLTGGSGTDGSHIPSSGGAPYIGSGNGGSSFYGQGGTAVNGATGHSGTSPGAGGGGAMDVNLTSTTFSGGTGAPGQIILSYWS